MSDHSEEIKFMIDRDGIELGIEYAKQCLFVFRKAARDRTHFAHCKPFREHFVRSIIYTKKFLKDYYNGQTTSP